MSIKLLSYIWNSLGALVLAGVVLLAGCGAELGGGYPGGSAAPLMTGSPTFTSPADDGTDVIVTVPVTADAANIWVTFYDNTEPLANSAGLGFATNAGGTSVDVTVTLNAAFFDADTFYSGKSYYPYVFLNDGGSLSSSYLRVSIISGSNYTFGASDIPTGLNSGIAIPYLTVN